MSSDDDRFTNHSNDPNTHMVGNHAVATRDIQPGEELTDDYTELVVLNFPLPNHHGVKWARGKTCSQ
jgi:SET domain-containing protein